MKKKITKGHLTAYVESTLHRRRKVRIFQIIFAVLIALSLYGAIKYW